MPRAPKLTRVAGNRAACYYRKSKDDSEGSIPVQHAACTAYAAGRGFAIVAEETDMESAYLDASATRAGYLRLMELARAGSIDHVVVWQLTRFGRDAAEALSRMKELKRLGVQLHSTSEDLTNPLLAGFLAVMAEDESRRISDRVRPRIRMLAAQGRHSGGKPPLGTIRGADGRLRPGPRLEIVRFIFEFVAAGAGVTATAQAVRERFDLGRPVHATIIARIVRNPAYIGTLRGELPDGYGDVPGAWPALIDPALWEQAQRTLDRRHVVQRRFGLQAGWWLRGLTFCQTCGGSCSIMKRTVVRRSGLPRDYIYYVCNRGCHGSTAHAERLQQYVYEQVRALTVPPAAAGQIRAVIAAMGAAAGEGNPTGRQAATRDRRDALARRDRIEQMMIDGQLAPDRGAVRLREVAAELRALDIRLAATAEPAVIDAELWVMRLTTTEWHARRLTDPEGYRDQLSEVVERLTIGPGGLRILQFTPLMLRLSRP